MTDLYRKHKFIKKDILCQQYFAYRKLCYLNAVYFYEFLLYGDNFTH